jgi:hypothetical protein
MAKAPAGTKKTKDAITKAASQKKAGVKVFIYSCLEMDKGKSKRKGIKRSIC